jgi:hypothetical protein
VPFAHFAPALLGCHRAFTRGVVLVRVLEQCGSFGGGELGGQRVALAGLDGEQHPDVVRQAEVERGEVAVEEQPVFGLVL